MILIYIFLILITIGVFLISDAGKKVLRVTLKWGMNLVLVLVVLVVTVALFYYFYQKYTETQQEIWIALSLGLAALIGIPVLKLSDAYLTERFQVSHKTSSIILTIALFVVGIIIGIIVNSFGH